MGYRVDWILIMKIEMETIEPKNSEEIIIKKPKEEFVGWVASRGQLAAMGVFSLVWALLVVVWLVMAGIQEFGGREEKGAGAHTSSSLATGGVNNNTNAFGSLE